MNVLFNKYIYIYFNDILRSGMISKIWNTFPSIYLWYFVCLTFNLVSYNSISLLPDHKYLHIYKTLDVQLHRVSNEISIKIIEVSLCIHFIIVILIECFPNVFQFCFLNMFYHICINLMMGISTCKFIN